MLMYSLRLVTVCGGIGALMRLAGMVILITMIGVGMAGLLIVGRLAGMVAGGDPTIIGMVGLIGIMARALPHVRRAMLILHVGRVAEAL